MRKVVQAAWRGSLVNSWELEGEALFLKNFKGYSALGILCELYRLMTGNGEWSGYPYLPQVFLGQAVKVPDAVREWADLTWEELEFLSGKSFKEVREWLSGSTLFLPHRTQQDLALLPSLTYH
jgi:hypothetical protein